MDRMKLAQRVAGRYLKADSRFQSFEETLGMARATNTPEAWKALAYQVAVDYGYDFVELGALANSMAQALNGMNVAKRRLKELERVPGASVLFYLPLSEFPELKEMRDGIAISYHLFETRQPFHLEKWSELLKNTIDKYGHGPYEYNADYTALRKEFIRNRELENWLEVAVTTNVHALRALLDRLPAIERAVNMYYHNLVEFRALQKSMKVYKDTLLPVLKNLMYVVRRLLPSEMAEVVNRSWDVVTSIHKPIQLVLKPLAKEVKEMILARSSWDQATNT